MMRIQGLDSIRGIACLVVLFYHVALLTIPFDKLSYSPTTALLMSTFLNGQAAVILFFVLSGFVLTGAVLANDAHSYQNYIIKRFLRLYIPYLVVVAAAIFLAWITVAMPRTALPPFQHTGPPLHWWNYLSLAAMFGIAGDQGVDGPLWTLCVEMQVSLIFPFIAIIPRKSVLAATLALALIGNLMGFSIPGTIDIAWQYPADSFGRIALTLHYLQFFAFGSLLYKFRDPISNIMKRLPLGLLLCIGIASIGACAIEQFTPSMIVKNITYSLPAGYWIALCACRNSVNAWLSHSVLRFFGQISYSLYLVHLPILVATLLLLGPTMGKPMPVCLGIVASFGAAFALNRLAEQPAIRLGRRLADTFAQALKTRRHQLQ